MNKAQSILNKKTISLLGSNSQFGRILSLLLKQSFAIRQLCLYDEHNIDVASDISLINTPCKVRAFCGRDQLPCALKNADVVLIADQSTLICDDIAMLLDEGAPRIVDYGNVIAESCSQAIIVVAATPVNSLLPLLSKVLTSHNAYHCNKVFGLTSVDNVRANAVFAQHIKRDPRKVVLPVVGGSSAHTRVPIFSQSRPQINLSKKAVKQLTKLIKYSDSKVFGLKGQGETVNKAYATSRFLHSVLAGLRGEPNIAEIALIRSVFVPGTNYFALPFILGPNGIEYRFPLPQLTRLEDKNICIAVAEMDRESKQADKYLSGVKKNLDSIIDSKDKDIMVTGLLDHVRATLSCKKANVEYTLMTKKPKIQVPLDQTPSKTPIPLKPLEPFPQSPEGCNPFDFPELPTCRRPAPPPPISNHGTCCNLEEPPKDPCKPPVNCKLNPCDTPQESGTNVSCYSATSTEQNTAQEQSSKAQETPQSCSTQNTKLTEHRNPDIDENRPQSNQQDQSISSTPQSSPCKDSNKMVLSGSEKPEISHVVNTEKSNIVNSHQPPLILSSFNSGSLQKRTVSKSKDLNHSVILGIGKSENKGELKIQLPKSASLISEHLNAMKEEGDKILPESKNLNQNKEIASDLITLNDDKILKALKDFEQKIKQDKNITEAKAFLIFKDIYNKLLKSKKKEPTVESTDEQNFINFIGRNLLNKDKLLKVEKSSKPKGDLSLNASLTDNSILTNFLQNMLKKDEISTKSDLLKDVSLAKLLLLKSLESDLKKDKSLVEVKNSTDSKALSLLASPSSKQILLNFLKKELINDKVSEGNKKLENNTDPKADRWIGKSNASKDLLKSFESKLKEDELLKNNVKDIEEMAKFLTKVKQDLVKSVEPEIKKDELLKNNVKDTEEMAKFVTKVKQDLVKSVEPELKKDELLKNNVKDTEEMAKFVTKVKQDLVKSVEPELKKDGIKSIQENTDSLINFALERKSLKSIKKDKLPTDNKKVENITDSKADRLIVKSNANKDLSESFESALNKDNLLKNKIKVQNTEEKVKFFKKIKQELEKSLESALKTKSIKENTGSFLDFASKIKRHFVKSFKNEKIDDKKVIKTKEPSPSQEVKSRSTLDYLKSFFLNPRPKKYIKREQTKFNPDFPRIIKNTENLDELDKSMSISTRMYAPQCPPQYLHGEYIQCRQKDNVEFDNVFEPIAKPSESNFNKSIPSQQKGGNVRFDNALEYKAKPSESNFNKSISSQQQGDNVGFVNALEFKAKPSEDKLNKFIPSQQKVDDFIFFDEFESKDKPSEDKLNKSIPSQQKGGNVGFDNALEFKAKPCEDKLNKSIPSQQKGGNVGFDNALEFKAKPSESNFNKSIPSQQKVDDFIFFDEFESKDKPSEDKLNKSIPSQQKGDNVGFDNAFEFKAKPREDKLNKSIPCQQEVDNVESYNVHESKAKPREDKLNKFILSQQKGDYVEFDNAFEFKAKPREDKLNKSIPCQREVDNVEFYNVDKSKAKPRKDKLNKSIPFQQKRDNVGFDNTFVFKCKPREDQLNKSIPCQQKVDNVELFNVHESKAKSREDLNKSIPSQQKVDNFIFHDEFKSEDEPCEDQLNKSIPCQQKVDDFIFYDEFESKAKLREIKRNKLRSTSGQVKHGLNAQNISMKESNIGNSNVAHSLKDELSRQPNKTTQSRFIYALTSPNKSDLQNSSRGF